MIDKNGITLTFDYVPSLKVHSYFKVWINAMFDQMLYDLNGVLISNENNNGTYLEFYP